MCVDLILRIVSLCLYLLPNFFDSCDSGIPGRKTNWTHFGDCIWISKFARANQLFLVSLHLVLFWKSSVWVALTLLYVASLFLPFCSLLEGLAPPAFASFIPFVGAISLLPACTPSLPCSAVPHSVRADNSHCFSPSCFRLGLFFFVFLCSSVCGFLLVQVDKHIRRLDADLARFEADLKDKLEGSDFETPGSRSLKSG